MLKPKKVAQSQPDQNGDYVTYYTLYSQERDRFMLDVHFTGEMDSDFLQALIVSFVEDCRAVKQDMFDMQDIANTTDLH